MPRTPYVKFYIDNFLAGTQGMTAEEVGFYMKLLCLQHKEHALELKLIRSSLNRKFNKIWPALECKFRQDPDGRFYNERWRIEMDKVAQVSERQTQAINKRWGKRDTMVLPRNAENSYHGMPRNDTMVLPRNAENSYHGNTINNKDLNKEDTTVVSTSKTEELVENPSYNQEELSISKVDMEVVSENFSPQKNIEMNLNPCTIQLKSNLTHSLAVSFNDNGSAVVDHVKSFLGQNIDDIAFWCESFLGRDINAFAFALNMYIAEHVAIGEELAPNLLKRNFMYFISSKRKLIMTAYQNSQRDIDWFDSSLAQFANRFKSPDDYRQFRDYYTKPQANHCMYFHLLANFNMESYVASWTAKPSANGNGQHGPPQTSTTSHLAFKDEEERAKYYDNGGF